MFPGPETYSCSKDIGKIVIIWLSYENTFCVQKKTIIT